MPIPPTDFDLFELWRRILSLVCGVYALVMTTQTIVRWTGYLSDGQDRLTRLAGRYVVARFLGVRLRRYWQDLVQILVLVLVFAGVVWAHRGLSP